MSWILAIVALVIAYQAGVLVVLMVAWRTPPTERSGTPADLGIPYDDIQIPTAGGSTLAGWWIPGGLPTAPTVILAHGWGRNAARMLPYIEILHPAGYDLVAFDARNHGRSDRDGFASMKKFSEDIRAVADEVARRRGEANPAFGVVGLSVGGAAAIHAAAYDPRLAAVATVGAFAHPGETMRPPEPWRSVLAPGMPLALRFIEWRVGARLDELAPERAISRAGAAFLLVHGERDEIVPVAHLRRLAAAAGPRAETWVMPGRGHSDPHLEPGFAERLRGFFAARLRHP